VSEKMGVGELLLLSSLLQSKDGMIILDVGLLQSLALLEEFDVLTVVEK